MKKRLIFLILIMVFVTPLSLAYDWGTNPGDGSAVNHDPNVLLRTQDLPPIYEENSNMYIFTQQNLQRRRNRLGVRPFMFEVDRTEAMDLDTELDFQVAEFLFMRRREAEQEKP